MGRKILLFFLLLFSISLSYSEEENPLRPRIFLEYSVRTTPININTSKVWLDGIDISKEVEFSALDLSYVPQQDLKEGLHEVKVLLEDQDGEQKIHQWSFEINKESAKQQTQIHFINPSPENGSVLPKNNIVFKIHIDTKVFDIQNLNILLSEEDQGFAKINLKNYNIDKSDFQFELANLKDGAKTLLIQYQQSQIQRSFVIDTHKPSIEHISVDRFIINKNARQPILIKTRFYDPPYHTASTLELSIIGPKNTLVKQIKNAYLKHTFKINPNSLKDWPEGSYPIFVKITDYAAHKNNNHKAAFLEIVSNKIEPISEFITLNPYPLISNRFETNISGLALAQSQISLFVNDDFISTQTTGKEDFNGHFHFRQIPLIEGFNAISFQLYDLNGNKRTEKLKAPGIVVDRTPPFINYFSPKKNSINIEPKPEIQFQIVDPFLDKEIDTKLQRPAGVNPNSIQLFINQNEVEVKQDGNYYRAKLKNDLKIGLQEVLLKAKDLQGNELNYVSNFKTQLGPIASFEARADKKILYINSDEIVKIKVNVFDLYKRPARDGSELLFSCNKGSITQKLTSINGIINAIYIPPSKEGKATVTISHPNLKRKLKLNFEIKTLPERTPVYAKVKLSKTKLIADQGKSSLTIHAKFFDAWDIPINDDVAINIENKLTSIKESQLLIENGSINFDVSSTNLAGLEKIILSHKNFKHIVNIPIDVPKIGAPAKIKIELLPKYLVAGSELPMRLKATIYDSFERPVKDGSLVKFISNDLQCASSGRTLGGMVINNIQAPDKPGQFELSIKCDNIEEKITVNIIPTLKEKDLVSINIKPFKTNPRSGNIKIEGQVYTDGSILAKGNQALFITSPLKNNHPSMVLVRDGIFSFTVLNCPVGNHALQLRCKSIQKVFQFKCIENKSINQLSDEDKNIGHYGKLEAILDISFHREVRNGSTQIGYILVRLIPLKENRFPIDQLNHEIISFNTSHGKILPKAFLNKLELKVPFSYQEDNKEVVVTAKIAGIENSISILPETQLPHQSLITKDLKTQLQYHIKGNEVFIIAKIVSGIPETAVVEIKSIQSNLSKQLTWKGEELRFKYIIPKHGQTDIITLTNGNHYNSLNLNLTELRLRQFSDTTDTIDEQQDDNSYNIDRGLKLIHLSGKLELQAGGRDKTRLRFRLLNNKNENLPDGTEVECYFPQGKINPHRVKVKRGLVSINLRSSDWVGKYPFTIKVGNIKKSIDIRLIAPDIEGSPLPNFPSNPRFKERRRNKR